MQFLEKNSQIIGWCLPSEVGAPPSGKSWIHHCNTLHSPLLLPPHEVMNMGPHAAGEGSETQLITVHT